MRDLLTFLLMVMMIFGCKKDAPEEPSIQDEPTPEPSFLDLIAGDTTGMQVIYFNDTVRPSYQGHHDHLNIDLDGNVGTEVTLNAMSTLPGLAVSPGQFVWISRLSSDTDVRFVGSLVTDTILRRTDSTLTFTGNALPWTLLVDYEEGCVVQDADEIITISPDIFRAMIYSEGDLIDTLSILGTDSIGLSKGSSQFYPPLSYLNDSTYIQRTGEYHYQDCYPIPFMQPFYVGYAIDTPSGTRHGALRLELINAITLVVHYAAIQP